MKISKENLEKLNFKILKNFNNCWIAGGAIASVILDEKIADIDIFFPSEDARKAAVKKFSMMGAEKIASYPLGDKFEYRGQQYDLIHAGRTPEETIRLFDWTACCAAIDKKGNFICHEKFFEHIFERKLYFLGNHPSPHQLAFKNKVKRLTKYLEKNYKIDNKMLQYWLSRMISDHNKLKNKRKLQVTEINVSKFKIDNLN